MKKDQDSEKDVPRVTGCSRVQAALQGV